MIIESEEGISTNEQGKLETSFIFLQQRPQSFIFISNANRAC